MTVLYITYIAYLSVQLLMDCIVQFAKSSQEKRLLDSRSTALIAGPTIATGSKVGYIDQQ